jgi:hypothetical protein
MENDFITRDERFMHKLGWIGLCLLAFSWGYNQDIFKKPKNK